MAHDVFLKLDGITGESQDKTHRGEIEVLNWTWSVAQESTMHTGSGGGTGKATVEDLVFEHYVDRSSPTLMQKCLTGTHIPEAKLTVRKAGGNPLAYLTLTMTKVLVTMVNPTSHADDDIKVRERVALSFAKVTSEYTVQNGDGGSGGTVSASYDIQMNHAP